MRIVAMKGSCGIAAGAGKVYDTIVAEIAKYNDVMRNCNIFLF